MTGCYRASCTRSVRPSSGCGAGRRPAGPGQQSTGGGGAAGISPAAERGRDVCDDHQQSCSSQELSLAQTCRQKLMRRGKTNKRMKRFELSTLSLARRCSTTELHPQGDRSGCDPRDLESMQYGGSLGQEGGGGAGWGCQESPNSKAKRRRGIKGLGQKIETKQTGLSGEKEGKEKPEAREG